MTMPIFKRNLMDLADGYKVDHRRQYPDGTTRVQTNWTPRGSRVEGTTHVVNFGLQYVLQEWLTAVAGEWFAEPGGKMVDYWNKSIGAYLGPDNEVGSQHISDLHDLQYLPLRFSALPEGTLVPLRVPTFICENSDPSLEDNFFWLPNYFETLTSAESWLPSTSATAAHRFRLMLERHAAETGGNADFVKFQGHDFSMRGMQGIAAGEASGAGHALSFVGSDTRSAIPWIEHFYDVDRLLTMILVSVAATEHSVMCAGGKGDELETIRRIIRKYPTGVLSVVSDTWDLWHVLTEILPQLKDEIMAREGVYVTRPDSGDPENILLGDRLATPGSPAYRGVLDLLGETFGTVTNAAGYKALDPHVGTIYGDGIGYDRGDSILTRGAIQGWQSTNEVFGLGSFHYTYVTRDTHGYAMKATWAEVDGEGHDLFKDPITDDGVKKSAKGRLAVAMGDDGDLRLIEQATPDQEAASLLRPVWENGQFLVRETFDEIRARLWPQDAAA